MTSSAMNQKGARITAPNSGTPSAESRGAMTIDMGRDVTRVMDTLGPEQNATLDHWAEQLQELLNTVVSQGGPAARRIKNVLNGVWLGHPLHPALTDAAIGAWSTGAML